MFRRAIAVIFAIMACSHGSAAELTPVESRWVAAAGPALAAAKKAGLAVRVVVEPGPAEGQAPMAMGVDASGCILVLSMRSNSLAESALDGVADGLRPILIEFMAIHEMAHCWRHVHGAWGSSKARASDGAVDKGVEKDSRAPLGELAMRAEEGFADLAAIAWIRSRRPERAVEAERWLAGIRGDLSVSGARHATLPWLALALPGFGGDAGADPFGAAASIWLAQPAGAEPGVGD